MHVETRTCETGVGRECEACVYSRITTSFTHIISFYANLAAVRSWEIYLPSSPLAKMGGPRPPTNLQTPSTTSFTLFFFDSPFERSMGWVDAGGSGLSNSKRAYVSSLPPFLVRPYGQQEVSISVRLYKSTVMIVACAADGLAEAASVG